jgi:hypothetical protein
MKGATQFNFSQYTTDVMLKIPIPISMNQSQFLVKFEVGSRAKCQLGHWEFVILELCNRIQSYKLRVTAEVSYFKRHFFGG